MKMMMMKKKLLVCFTPSAVAVDLLPEGLQTPLHQFTGEQMEENKPKYRNRK